MTRLVRFVAIAGACFASAPLAVGACGGRTTDPSVPSGYVDDAGAFHQADGHVLFSPGSGCVGFVAPTWADQIDPSQDWVGPQIDQGRYTCDADSQCSFYPSAYGGQMSCSLYGDAGPFCHMLDNEPPPPCNPGGNGDVYCRAYFQQFVVAPQASAVTHCAPCADWNSSANAYACKTGVCLSDCKWPGVGWSRALYVQRGPSAACERPCKP